MLDIITIIDEGLQSALAPLWCIIIWACFSAVFSMFLYKLISPQKRLQALKAEHKNIRSELIRHDGDFASLQQLIFKDLGLSLKQIGIIFPAFIVSVLPIFALMFCLFVRYAYALPNTSEAVTLTFHPSATTQEIHWPDTASTLDIKDTNGITLFTLPLPAAIPEITKPYWLTTLFPNPIGVLPEHTDVESVSISLPSKHYTHFGPDWMRGFEFWYIMTLLVVSLFIKIRFRII